MGLLDDAIRDHLELKRRRGADPTEVERAEREALGPVRRQPEGADDVDYAEGVAAPAEPGVGSDDLFYDDEQAAYEDELAAEPGWDEAVPEPSFREPVDPDPMRDSARSTEPKPFDQRERFDAHERFDEPQPSRQPDPGVDTKPHEAVRPEYAEPSSPPPARAPEPSSFDDPTAPPAHRPGGIHEETEEYDVEAEEQAGDEGEDVLEETPEFLQDTPDHDRLWFEQRPPRDFNFDG